MQKSQKPFTIQLKIFKSLVFIALVCTFLFQFSSKIFAQNEKKEASKPALSSNNLSKKESISSSIQNSISDLFSIEKEVNSLMFNKKQISDIKKALSAFKSGVDYFPEGYMIKQEDNQEANKELDLSYIHLGGIIYFSETNWTLWYNEKKISSSGNNSKKEIYIKKVDSKSATFIWKMSLSKWKIITGLKDSPNLIDGAVKKEFTLMQNQSYNLSTDKVSEGKIITPTQPIPSEANNPSTSLDLLKLFKPSQSQDSSQNPAQNSPESSSPSSAPSSDGQDLKSQIENKFRDLTSSPK